MSELHDDRLDGADADARLVHALLIARLGEDADARGARLARVADALGASAPALRFARPLRRWSLAALVLIAVSVGVAYWTGSPAHAEWSRIVEAFRATDQTFDIVVEAEAGDPDAVVDSRGRRPRRPGRPRPPRFQRFRGPDAAERLDGARLHVRGEDFVLVRELRGGRRLVKGFTDGETWILRPRPPAGLGPSGRPGGRGPREAVELPAGDPGALGTGIPDEVLDLLLVDVVGTLEGIRGDYDLTRTDAADLAEEDRGLIHFAAERRAPEPRRPERIEVWVERDSLAIRRIECYGVHFRGRPGHFHIAIDRAEEGPLPEDWFRREGHR